MDTIASGFDLFEAATEQHLDPLAAKLFLEGFGNLGVGPWQHLIGHLEQGHPRTVRCVHVGEFDSDGPRADDQ